MTTKKFAIAVFSLTVPFLIFNGYTIATGQIMPFTNSFLIKNLGLTSIYVMGVLYCFVKLKNKNKNFPTIYFSVCGSGWLILMGFFIPFMDNDLLPITLIGLLFLIGIFGGPLSVIAFFSICAGTNDYPDFETLFNIKNNCFRDDPD